MAWLHRKAFIRLHLKCDSKYLDIRIELGGSITTLASTEKPALFGSLITKHLLTGGALWMPAVSIWLLVVSASSWELQPPCFSKGYGRSWNDYDRWYQYPIQRCPADLESAGFNFVWCSCESESRCSHITITRTEPSAIAHVRSCAEEKTAACPAEQIKMFPPGSVGNVCTPLLFIRKQWISRPIRPSVLGRTECGAREWNERRVGIWE